MAESIVRPEMINRAAYEELRAADMPEDQAKAVAAHLPDWSQFATRQDLVELRGEMSGLESRLVRWMIGIFLAMASLLAAAVSVLVAVLGRSPPLPAGRHIRLHGRDIPPLLRDQPPPRGRQGKFLKGVLHA